MEKKLHKGGNSCSSTSPRSTEVSKDHGIVVEHYIQISNLEEQLSQKTDENPPLMSQPQIQQLHSSPRRRVLPNVVNSNPIDLPSALLNNNSIINRSIGFRVRRFIGSSSSRHNWSLVLHGFPLLVLLCFFLLWWFSSPGSISSLSWIISFSLFFMGFYFLVEFSSI